MDMLPFPPFYLFGLHLACSNSDSPDQMPISHAVWPLLHLSSAIPALFKIMTVEVVYVGIWICPGDRNPLVFFKLTGYCSAGRKKRGTEMVGSQWMNAWLKSKEGNRVRGRGRETQTYVFDINIIVIQRHLDQYMSHFIYLLDKMNTM